MSEDKSNLDVRPFKRYFLKLSYLGKNYHGWQIQPNAISVQGEIQKAMSTLFRQPIEILGAGRTDTGVHATEMYAHFDVDAEQDLPGELVYRLNKILPEDIAIQALIPVNSDAHARFSATKRAYRYEISRVKDPFTSDVSWYYPRSLDFESMNKAAAMLPDFKDFACFAKSKGGHFTSLCDLEYAYWEQVGDRWIFHIRANRFLRNMVRAIVGTLIEVGEGKISPDDIPQIIASGNRSSAGSSVPAHGLHLVEVTYPPTILKEQHV